jgi:23S rRNA-/tRNA-specific pseudouridylate synthase
VSGAIVVARHVRAAQRLATQFENRTVTKVYWAVVEGRVEPDEGTWTDHLHKRHGMAQTIVVPPDDPRGKLAILRYRVLEYLGDPSRHGESPAATWVGNAKYLESRSVALPASIDEQSSPGQDGPPICTWLEIQLETGRTHQIRIQCASRGHAVLGDYQYGATRPFGEQFEDERLRAIALHARQLGFNHPMTNEPVDIVAPLPEAWAYLNLPRA